MVNSSSLMATAMLCVSYSVPYSSCTNFVGTLIDDDFDTFLAGVFVRGACFIGNDGHGFTSNLIGGNDDVVVDEGNFYS